MEPIKSYEDKLEGVGHEILSAMSALNMHPEPLDPTEGEYLSSMDKWAQHALRHLETAFELLMEIRGVSVARHQTSLHLGGEKS